MFLINNGKCRLEMYFSGCSFRHFHIQGKGFESFVIRESSVNPSDSNHLSGCFALFLPNDNFGSFTILATKTYVLHINVCTYFNFKVTMNQNI